MELAAQILERARAAAWTITVAESCTGGMVAAALTDLPGSSDMFEQGFVTYSNAAKTSALGVRPTTLDTYGAVSEQTAREMVIGAHKAAKATVAVSITGIAGPGGSDHKPEGRVCFAISSPGVFNSHTMEFGALGRDKVRQKARDHALQMILDALPQEINHKALLPAPQTP
ncbi:MAG: CinA family protein [Planktomarina sp.]